LSFVARTIVLRLRAVSARLKLASAGS